MEHSLVIIGNGFDLTLGLNSSFSDFLDNFYEDLSKKLRPLMKLYNIYNDPKGNKYYYEGHLVTPNLVLQYIDGFDIEYQHKDSSHSDEKIYTKDNMNNLGHEYKSTISQIFNDSDINFWSFYFKIREYEEDPNWNNIESDIYSFLTLQGKDNIHFIIKGVSIAKNHGIGSSVFIRDIAKKSNRKSIFVVYLLIYIFSHKLCFNKNWLQREIDRKTHKKIEFNKLIFRYLNGQLSYFERDLNKYLLTCISNYKDEYKTNYVKMSNMLLYYMTYKQRFSLINFNYTEPVKDMNVPMLNVHGKLQKGSNRKNFPIIGISNNNIGFSDPAYKFTKNYKIMKLSYSNNILQDKHINKIEFFGQSFDSADFSYFRDIFNFYDISSPDNNIKLIFYYVPHDIFDDQGAIRQIKKIDSLFEMYYISKLNNKYYKNKYVLKEQADKKAEDLLHVLKFKGQLVIENIYDKLPKEVNSKIQDINGYGLPF